MKLLMAVFLACVLATTVAAQDGPVLVVASQKLNGGHYERAVMLATPFDGGHIGLILNRPSQSTMAMLFPQHAASAMVKDPVYFGGYTARSRLFALTRAKQAPSPKSIELAQGVWLMPESAFIDGMIETRPNEARYYVGIVAWAPGALTRELEAGEVTVRPVDHEKLFLPDTTHLYESLRPRITTRLAP